MNDPLKMVHRSTAIDNYPELEWEDMEISNNLILSEIELNKGLVECPKCHSGKLNPLNPRYNINHYFICGKCGEKVIVEPSVIVD